MRICHVCITAHIWASKELNPLTYGLAALLLRAAGRLAVLWLIFFAFQCCVAVTARAEWICRLVNLFRDAGSDSRSMCEVQVACS